MHSSYTSADTLPAKLIQDYELIKKISDGHIPARHVQLCPTNSCNLNCSYCSCGEEDRSLEMPYSVAHKLATDLIRNGCRAVTITGGGEPLCHPNINEIIELYKTKGMDIGLTTNGIELDSLTKAHRLTWCRISHDDARELSDEYLAMIANKMRSGPQCSWAFSYMASAEPDIKKLNKLCSWAEQHNMTHVRIVADLLSSSKVDMVKLKKAVKSPLAVFQQRGNPEPGQPCWIAYLKPLIGPDGKMYRCCGVQYSLKTPSKKLPEELCFGHIDRIDEALRDYTSVSQGLKCVQCFYGDYNRVLGAIQEKLTHTNFL